MTIKSAVGHGMGRAQELIKPSIGALAAATAGSLGGLFEGQGLYKMLIDGGGFAVVTFVLISMMRRSIRSEDARIEADQKRTSAIIAASEAQVALLERQLTADREMYELRTKELHKRFDRSNERHEREAREDRERIAVPVAELAREVGVLIGELRHCTITPPKGTA